MKRRTLLAGLALPLFATRTAWAAAPALTAQDRTDLTRIETYLDGLRSLMAREQKPEYPRGLFGTV